MRDRLFRLLFLLTRALRPRERRRLRPLRPGDTVLYLQFERPLGCCVHGTPLVGAFQRVCPGVRVIVASRGPGAATLRHHPGVERIIETGGEPGTSPGSIWRTVRELRRKLRAEGLQPDVIVQDASSRRGSLALVPALLRLAPAVGFADAPALYDRHLPYDPTRSLIDNNLRIVEALGAPIEHLEPEVFFTAAELARVREFLPQNPKSRGLVGFVLQGSGGQRTGWHDVRFAEVVRWVEAQGYGTVFFGTAPDQDGIERVQGLAGSRGLSLAGKTSIPEAAAALCLCDLLVTVDTGTMHLGRAVGVPMVVLGPSWQRPLEWLPLGLPNVRILRGPDRTDVPPGYRLDEIDVPAVLAAATDLLQRYPSSNTAREQRLEQRLSTTRA